MLRQRRVAAESVADHELLLGQLASDSRALRLLTELASSPDVDDRMWVAEYATRVLGAGAVEVLDVLSRDRDSDVRIEAMSSLVRIDPSTAHREYPRLVRRLRSKDFWEPVVAMWLLAEVNDAAAIAEIRAVVPSWTGAVAFRARIAEIVIALLSGRDREILMALRDHDHDENAWLAHAARLIGTTDARLALEMCADGAPDASCRGECQRELAAFREKGRRAIRTPPAQPPG